MNPLDQSQFEKKVPIDMQSEHRAKKIILALRKVMHHMDHHSRRLNKCYGLTVPQIICLYEIYEKGVVTISVLSKSVHLSMSTLVGIIDRLEEKGFIKRTRYIKDRRIIFINITEKGTEFVCLSPYLLHNRLHDNLKDLTEIEQTNLASSIDLLVNLLQDI
jgi:DNA-binding MarR family transcriptional regulator